MIQIFKKYFFLLFSLFFLFACKTDQSSVETNPQLSATTSVNIFDDAVVQKLYEYKHDRNAAKLIPFLTNDYVEYRLIAAKAFASVQSPEAIPPLVDLLTDSDPGVAKAAAFALGQTSDPENLYQLNENLLRYFHESISEELKAEILTAIGKRGTEKQLKFVCGLNFEPSMKELCIAQAKSLAYFAARGFQSDDALRKAFELIEATGNNAQAAYYASFYFTRLKETDISNFSEKILAAFRNPQNFIYTQINLMRALDFCNKPEKKDFVVEILLSNVDYRIKINVLRSLQKASYQEYSSEVFPLLTHANNSISVCAAQYFENHGVEKDAAKYFELSKKLKHWRTRSIMLAAALRYSKEKTNITKAIISGYGAAQHLYEKAFLLRALSGNPAAYKWVDKQTFESEEKVIKTYGMEALVGMRRNSGFEKLHKKLKNEKKIDLKEEFAFIFKKAIQSRDVALIAYACEAIRDPKLELNNAFKNTYFLTQALNQSVLPRDVESYIELQKTIAYIDGTEKGAMPKLKKLDPDWDFIASIPQNQKVKINTSKGSFIVQLFVNEAPETVSSFLKLINQGYFNSLVFHRVVPNFVVQTGCFRGDGWGTPSFIIPSEFSELEYNEGTLGMASAGKDTESSQWFVTHAPFIHLNGKYTVFGEVVEGLDIIHKLEIEDELLDFEIL